MAKKVKTIISTFFIALWMMTSGAVAATVNVVDVLPWVVGSDPIDWENINGSYYVYADDDYDAFYSSDDLAVILPESTLADLTAVWSLYNGGDPIVLDTFVLTDDLGLIIDQEFWVALACHHKYVLEITSRWIGDGELIPNPLPPSVIAFMSAMFGLGYLLCRKRIKKA